MRATWFVIAGVAACGGGSTASVDGPSGDGSGSSQTTSVSGTVEGRPFAAKDAISRQIDHSNGFSFQGPASFVEITDFAGACGLAGQDLAPTDSRILLLGVAIDDASGAATAPTGPAAFTVYPSTNPLPAATDVAQVFYGSGCDKTVAYSGTSGTITVSAVKADGSLEGSFDVTISCAGFSSCAGPDAHLSGTFSSTSCSALNIDVIPSCS